MDFGKLGDFRIGGSIDTQFRTSLAVERVLIATGEKAGGITSFLTTIEFIGHFFAIFWGLFFICLIVVIQVLLFLISIYKYFFVTRDERKEVRSNYMSDEEIKEGLARFELTEEDEEEIKNFH